MNRVLLFLFAAFVNSSVMATTIWAPVDLDDDVNAYTLFAPSEVIIGVFDDNDQTFSNAGLQLNTGDRFEFTSLDAGGYSVSNGNDVSGTTFLTDTYNFILGLSLDGGSTWMGNTSEFELFGSNTFLVAFGDYALTLLADVQIAPPVADVVPVPSPSTVWLFVIAFLGMILFSRRGSFNSTENKVLQAASV